MTNLKDTLAKFRIKLHNVYHTVFQLSGYDEKQLKEKSEVLEAFLVQAIKEPLEEVKNVEMPIYNRPDSEPKEYFEIWEKGFNVCRDQVKSNITNFLEGEV